MFPPNALLSSSTIVTLIFAGSQTEVDGFFYSDLCVSHSRDIISDFFKREMIVEKLKRLISRLDDWTTLQLLSLFVVNKVTEYYILSLFK